MVRRFLLHCLLLSLPVMAMLAGYCGFNARYFPAPHITNNLSINEKAMLLNRRSTPEVNILALGSSMTQINLSSKAVIERFCPVVRTASIDDSFATRRVCGKGADRLDGGLQKALHGLDC